MQTGQREIRMMWLMGLTIVAIAAWFLAVPLLSALCGIALIMSVMHDVDSIENPSMTLAEQRGIAFQPRLKVPLYLAAFCHFNRHGGAMGRTHWIGGSVVGCSFSFDGCVV